MSRIMREIFSVFFGVIFFFALWAVAEFGEINTTVYFLICGLEITLLFYLGGSMKKFLRFVQRYMEFMSGGIAMSTSYLSGVKPSDHSVIEMVIPGWEKKRDEVRHWIDVTLKRVVLLMAANTYIMFISTLVNYQDNFKYNIISLATMLMFIASVRLVFNIGNRNTLAMSIDYEIFGIAQEPLEQILPEQEVTEEE